MHEPIASCAVATAWRDSAGQTAACGRRLVDQVGIELAALHELLAGETRGHRRQGFEPRSGDRSPAETAGAVARVVDPQQRPLDLAQGEAVAGRHPAQNVLAAVGERRLVFEIVGELEPSRLNLPSTPA